MRYWLMKSEPSDVSIDDLAKLPKQTIDWYGIRNYQARNFMRDLMKIGDLAFFYHSNCDVPGIAGIVKVSKLAYPDRFQFHTGHTYCAPNAPPDNPRWLTVDVTRDNHTNLLSLKELREFKALKNMRVLQKGNRLSITPVTEDEWTFIEKHLK
jgi:predicted RNA-binding protein with PUA-like domain